MNARCARLRRALPAVAGSVLFLCPAAPLLAQQGVLETRDPRQPQDPDFAKAYAEWTSEPRYGSPLVDHLPLVEGIPTPKDVLGYHIGAPKKLTYYADILKYYRALAAATPRVQVETIGRSDEGRELVVVWVSSEQNIANLARNRANLARIADPRGLTDAQVREIIAHTRPHYHLIGGLHSGETGPPEMLMELVYRLATETSPLIDRIRENVIVSVTPAAEPDGRDRNIDWFYRGLEMQASAPPEPEPDSTAAADTTEAGGSRGRGGRGGSPSVPYWGKYVHHDNNRDINLSQMSMRALTDWYFTAHPPIMHDLHESLTLLYTYSGGPPQNPNLDPVLFGELNWFANWELSQMTKWGMPGVYTHAFMDGWSPGYLGSVAYNHNGMMKMYETQSGRDVDLDSLAAAVRDSAAAEERTDARSREGRERGATADSAAGQGGGGRGGDTQAAGGRGRGGDAQTVAGRGGRGGRGAVPTGRGGGQPREWYRGIPVPDDAVSKFTRRNNTNYMQTGVLSALQLTAMFPSQVLESFYVKTRNSIEDGRTEAPFGYALPPQRDMTRVVTLVNILRAQGIEVGQLTSDLTLEEDTLPRGSYVIKLDQPYGRLARNLLEKQDYPDPALRTYDDSGWTMGLAFNADVREIRDSTILGAAVTPVDSAVWRGRLTGAGDAGLAVAHHGSTNMITFRYRLRHLAMEIAEQPFQAAGDTFPAGSFIVTGSAADLGAARAIADSLGLAAAALDSLPAVDMHDGDAPRVAIYSQWSGTQDLGWYRYTFDRFGIPYDLIYKERVAIGNLTGEYDVIVMAAQSITRANVLAAPAARPQPYQKTDKYQFLGMYGETPDMTGGFGTFGVAAVEKFLEEGGTIIATAGAVRFPIEFGFARTVDIESPSGVNAQKPLIQAEITRAEHPVFYGYDEKVFPIKYGQNSVFRVGIADQDRVLARYVGGDSAVLSGLMVGADNVAGRAFAVDVTSAHNGRGRVLMFANNPIYRWQNHGEFNMVFNGILNWNDVPRASRPVVIAERERPAMLPCPWAGGEAQPPGGAAAANEGGRRSIPDCVPPGWQPPAELMPYQPPALPADRPRPIVDDYLEYVVTEPPPDVVARFDLDTAYYKKFADANGYPILASAKVSDAALAIVRDQVNYMLAHRPDVRDTMIARGARIVIMAETEYTMDIPEQRGWTVPKYLDPRLTPGERSNYYEAGGLGYRSPEHYWNARARGMGGTLTSCAEENVLGFYNTRYWGTNICIHEFSHGIMGAGIGNADPIWYQEIVNAYKAAKAACRVTTNGYGGNTFNEYWATGVEWYVGNGGRDRAALKEADPLLYALITRLIPEDKELPVRANVAKRTRQQMAELVQGENPEWWQREQQRQREAGAARAGAAGGRGGGGGRGGRGGPGAQTCVPQTN